MGQTRWEKFYKGETLTSVKKKIAAVPRPARTSGQGNIRLADRSLQTASQAKYDVQQEQRRRVKNKK